MSRICQISHVEQTFNFLRPLCAELHISGHDVHVASSLDKGGSLIREYLNGIDVTVHRVPTTRTISLGTFTTSVLTLARFFRDQSFDVVHVHGPLPSYQVRIAARLAATPHVIYHAHGFYFHSGMSPWKLNASICIEKAFGRLGTDAILTINTEDYELARSKRFLSRPERIVYAPGVGIDTDRFHPPESAEEVAETRRRLGLRMDDIVVLFVGRLVREKGILDLVRAFASLHSEFPRARLVVVGEALASERDRSTAADLDRILHSTKTSESTLMLGRREDIPDLLRAANVFALPSYREGLPVALMEAMATALPCVATNIRGSRDLISSNVNGLLVPVGDPQALRDGIAAVLSDTHEVHTLGVKARHKIQKNHSVAVAVSPQMELYSTLLE